MIGPHYSTLPMTAHFQDLQPRAIVSINHIDQFMFAVGAQVEIQLHRDEIDSPGHQVLCEISPCHSTRPCRCGQIRHQATSEVTRNMGGGTAHTANTSTSKTSLTPSELGCTEHSPSHRRERRSPTNAWV